MGNTTTFSGQTYNLLLLLLKTTRYRFFIVLLLLLLYASISAGQTGRRPRRPNCRCPRAFKPVCATDGQTYNNLCKLQCRAQMDSNNNNNNDLRLAYNGTCCPRPFCPSVTKPICDNQEMTHSNECMFRYAYCVMRKIDGTILTIDRKTPCKIDPSSSDGDELCQTDCSYAPKDLLCDTKGQTFQNFCHLNQEQCQARKAGKQIPVLAFKGACSLRHIEEQESQPIKNPSAEPETEPTPESPPKPEPSPSPETSNTLIGVVEPEAESETAALTPKATAEAEPTISQSEPEGAPEGESDSHPKGPASEPYAETESEPASETETGIPEPKPESESSSASGTYTHPKPEPLSEESSLRELPASFGGSAFGAEPEPHSESEPPLPESESEPEPKSFEEQSSWGKAAEEARASISQSIDQLESYVKTGGQQSSGTKNVNLNLYPERIPTLDEPSEPDLNKSISSVGYSSESEPSSSEHSKYPLTAAEPEPEPVHEKEPTSESESNSEPQSEIASGSEPYGEPEHPYPESESEPSDSSYLHQQEVKPSHPVPETEPESEEHEAWAVPESELEAFSGASESEPEPESETTQLKDTLSHYSSEPEPEAESAHRTIGSNNNQKRRPAASIRPPPLPPLPTAENLPPPLPNSGQALSVDDYGEPELISWNEEDQVTEKEKKNRILATQDKVSGVSRIQPQIIIPQIKNARRQGGGQDDNDELGDIPYYEESQGFVDEVPSPSGAAGGFNRQQQQLSGGIQSASARQNQQNSVVNIPNEDERAAALEKNIEAKMCSANHCQKTFQPVCDSNGQTHINLCVFEFASCLHRERTGRQLLLMFPRACKSTKSNAKPFIPGGGRGGQSAAEISRSRSTAAVLTYTIIPNIVKSTLPPRIPLTTTTQATPLRPISKTVKTAEEGGPQKHEAAKDGTEEETDAVGMRCPECSAENELFLVCDNHNTTHQNLCKFNAASCRYYMEHGMELIPVHFGPCDAFSVSFAVKDEQCPEVCASEFYPLCDSLNQTYDNLCKFQMASCLRRKATGGKRGMVLQHLGKCGDPVELHRIYSSEEENPSDDGDKMDKKQWSWWNNLDTDPPPPSPPKKTVGEVIVNDLDCPMPDCPDSYSPICDNTGETHSNLCGFAHARCLAHRKGEVLQLAHEGECPVTNCSAITTCPAVFDPICGSDFETYWNKCVFQQHQCKQKDTEGSTTLEILFKGDCTECIVECLDAENEQFVCDSLGDTHSLCEYRMASCIYQKKFDLRLTVEHNGQCCPSVDECVLTEDDEQNHQPVCDSNGTIHANMCAFSVEQCEHARSTGGTADLRIVDLSNCAVQFRGPTIPTEVFAGRGNLTSPAVPAVEPTTPSSLSAATTNNTGTGRQQQIQQIDAAPVSIPIEETIAIASPSASTSPLDHAANSIDLVHATAEKCPTACEKMYAPVCGTNGKTYVNQCFLLRENCGKMSTTKKNEAVVGIDYPGECCMHECPKQWSPVCDSRGNTHPNLCEFEVARCVSLRKSRTNLEIESFTECLDSPCRKNHVCSNKYEPVCGSDDRTYVNQCHLDRAICLASNGVEAPSLKLQYQGTCCQQECSHEFQPVCDTHGKTQINRCVFERAACLAQRMYGEQLNVAYTGACCDRPCTNDYSPVCDGNQTHSNLCHFKVAECMSLQTGMQLTIKHEGQCCSTVANFGGKLCKDSTPVCDNRGTTHSNACLFNHAKCMARQHGLPELTAAYQGECCPDASCSFNNGTSSPATSADQAVCDNLQMTHLSACHFSRAKCLHDRRNPGTPLNIAYSGECCDKECEDDFDPVCDQHGGMYNNKCFFSVASCKSLRTTRSLLLQTPCPERRAVKIRRRNVLRKRSAARRRQIRQRQIQLQS